MVYDVLKALHIVAVIAWMAGLLYLPRLFVYHADAEKGSKQSETFKVMERRLYRGIMNPAMILVWVFGLSLDSDQPTTVTVRRFVFPAWRLTPALPLGAADPYRLVSFVSPAGRHEWQLDRRILPAEEWGWRAFAVSLIALVLIVTWRRRPLDFGLRS